MLGDGTYSVMELLASTRNHLTWITRFRLVAALFNFPPPYSKSQQGRPPLKGEKLPAPQSYLNNPDTIWQQVHFSEWYDEQNKLMEISSGTAIWYRAGKPIVPLKWVLIRDPEAKHDPICIQSTDLELEPFEIEIEQLVFNHLAFMAARAA